MNYLDIYKKTEDYVKDLFAANSSPTLTYHNLNHTEYVVNKAKEIAGHYQLSEKDMLIVFISAWFHDTGYLFVAPEVHEEKSVEIMKSFLKDVKMEDDTVEQVSACIIATKHPRSPQGLLQEIICDADTYNFGTKSLKDTNNLVYQEWKQTHPEDPRRQFDTGAVSMLKAHRFYTDYCQENLEKRKAKNIEKLKKKIKKSPEKEEPAEQKVLAITEKAGTTKGMQTMLRVTSSNHIQLSDMADSKANILISINAIIISVILSVLLRKLQTDPYLTIPTIIFLLSAVVTIVISILATRPKVNIGLFNEEDVFNKKTNLLFFGNFHKMKQEEYENAMRIMMKDSDYLYSSMVVDIYHLGTVLGRKYKLVRLAYNVFMIGIIASVVAFGIASFFSSPEPTTSVITGGSPFK